MIQNAACEVDTVDDVAPLIRTAHLQKAAIAAVQLQEVVGLEDHVVELEERERLLPVEAGFHRLEGQHPVDAEMPTDVAQEIEVVQLVQPLGVVQHQRARRAVVIGQVAVEDRLHSGDVLVDRLGRKKRTLLGAERRIAYLGGAAAHQRDRLVAGLLEPAQKHDVQQVTHMQRLRRGVIADIGRDHARDQSFVEALQIGAVGQEAALDDRCQKVGFRVVGHGVSFMVRRVL